MEMNREERVCITLTTEEAKTLRNYLQAARDTYGNNIVDALYAQLDCFLSI